MFSTSSECWRRKRLAASVSHGKRVSTSASMTLTAQSGNRPTIERTLSRIALSSLTRSTS
jgi:hypothetical protein